MATLGWKVNGYNDLLSVYQENVIFSITYSHDGFYGKKNYHA